MNEINNKKDILLLLLYSPGKSNNFNESIIGRTRLVKSLFLFKNEQFRNFKQDIPLDESKFYEFISWNYGPFSFEVYDDINFFILNDFIQTSETSISILPETEAEWEEWLNNSEINENDLSDELTELEFKLTEKGLAFARRIYDPLSSTQKEILKNFKEKINTASLRAIIRYVYKKYPDFIDRSLIADQILDF